MSTQSPRQGLPIKIVKIVYDQSSFTDAELERGNFNLTHYLYFYATDSEIYFKAKIQAALRKGAKISLLDGNYQSQGELSEP